MAQGDLTRAFSRRSKKEKERDERERERERESMRFHELAVDLCEWRGMHGEGEGVMTQATCGNTVGCMCVFGYGPKSCKPTRVNDGGCCINLASGELWNNKKEIEVR